MANLHDKFPQRLGVEFTWLLKPKSKRKGHLFYIDHIAEEIKTELKRDRFPHWACYEECDALEIPTPIMKSMGELHKWWEAINRKYISKYPLVTHSPTEVSGGMHIHISLKGLRKNDLMKRVVANVVRDVWDRPYLQWIFNDPWDVGTADWIGKTYCSTCAAREYPWVVAPASTEPHLCWNTDLSDFDAERLVQQFFMMQDKEAAVRYDSNNDTLEFRFLDMGKNWKEVEAVVRFVVLYFEWIIKLTKREIQVGTHDWDVVFTKASIVAEFKKLLKTLDLKYDDYKVFVRRNLNVRIDQHRYYGKTVFQ